MRTLKISLLVFIISISASAQPTGWVWQNPLPQGNLLFSVDLDSSGFGIAGGEFGTILKTTDGGLMWELKTTNTTSGFIKVEVVNSSIAYAISSGLTIKSTDGGENWFTIPHPTNSQRDIFFLDELTGFIIGNNGAFFETTDGGETWLNQNSGTTSNISCVYFLNKEVGIIGAHFSIVLYTNNGGNSWIPLTLQPAYQYYIWDVYLLDENKIFVLGGTSTSDYVFMSEDMGQSWTRMIGGSTYLTEICFADSMNGLISGYNHGSGSGGRIFRTADGGYNWQAIVVNVGNQTALTSISFPSIQLSVSVGEHGRMVYSSDCGSNWIQTSYGPLNSFDDVSFYDENRGIAVEIFGSIATSDGGNTWIATQGGNGYRCTMPSPNVCFTAGGYNLAKSTDGGFTWIQHPISSDHYFMTISFCDTINGIATAVLGAQGKVIRTFNGGETWAQIGSIFGHYIYDVCFVNPSIIYACSGSSFVFKSTDGGYTWTQQNTGISGSILYAIDFVNPEVGYVAGQHGKIIKTTNGGNTWSLLSTGINNQIDQIDFKDENNGLVACGKLLHTSDGGNSWEIKTIIPNNIKSASIISDNIWYAVGQYGAILKTNNGGTPVELFSFTATKNVNEIILNWSTATETNNSGFEILRFTQNVNDGWNRIGFVTGNGTTTETQHYSFTDNDVKPGKYQYKLKQIDYDGTIEYSQIVEVEIPFVNEFSLSQNYPNPFNPTTSLQYAIGSRQFVTLKVYDLLGREITTLVNEEKPAGEYEVEFNGANLPSGIYFYQIKAGEFVETRKMVLLK